MYYNTFDLTSQCIRSIHQYTQAVVFEIILVDNASSERSADDFLREFPDIKLVKNSDDLGFAKGNNIGINHAKSDLILLLNNDTELRSNVIE